MSTLTGGDLNLVKPALTDDHKVTIGTDLPANFQKIDDEFTAHLADTATMHGAVSTATPSKLAVRDASGYLFVKNRATKTDGVWATTEYQVETVSAGGKLITALVVPTATKYLVFASLQTSGNTGDVGVYSVARYGVTTIIDTIVAATGVTITIDGTYHIVGTYASAGSGFLSVIQL